MHFLKPFKTRAVRDRVYEKECVCFFCVGIEDMIMNAATGVYRRMIRVFYRGWYIIDFKYLAFLAVSNGIIPGAVLLVAQLRQ